MYEHQDFETAYRCNVEKAGNTAKLALRPKEELIREEHFVMVETSYRHMRQVMLAKKFEGNYQDSLDAAEEGGKDRIGTIVSEESVRRSKIMANKSLSAKGVTETYGETSRIKAMKGPFYQLCSRQGCSEDDFVNCAQMDLIKAATTAPPSILILGKPRSGKTSLSKVLCTRLDLVHINVENWIARVLEKIKTYEPPDDLEEGQEPPKFLTDLEE